MPYTFSVYVRDRPGVLSRVTSMFHKYGLNIGAFTVGPTQEPGISCMIIGVDLVPEKSRHVEANLYKLLDVVLVRMNSDVATFTRELALIKIKVQQNPEACIDQLSDGCQIQVLAQERGAAIVEITGRSEQIDALVEIFRPCGILEMVRTGCLPIETGSANRIAKPRSS
jgi:acetolactate synthase-1/3 small subunit